MGSKNTKNRGSVWGQHVGRPGDHTRPRKRLLLGKTNCRGFFYLSASSVRSSGVTRLIPMVGRSSAASGSRRRYVRLHLGKLGEFTLLKSWGRPIPSPHTPKASLHSCLCRIPEGGRRRRRGSIRPAATVPARQASVHDTTVKDRRGPKIRGGLFR